MVERFEVHRLIPAPADVIFAVLCDPAGHVAIDSSGMLMSSTGGPVAAVGDSFVVHMDREALNDVPLELYDVTVSITSFEPDRHIGHLVLRLVTDRPGVEGASDLPDLVGDHPASDARNPRPYRRSERSAPD